MKARKVVKTYSVPIAKKLSLPEKEVRKVMNQFMHNVINTLKQGFDVRLDDYMTINTNKEARLKFYHQLKEKQCQSTELNSQEPLNKVSPK
jgi:nucleoid DNA-binding protein